jgi:hypothetical protein
MKLIRGGSKDPHYTSYPLNPGRSKDPPYTSYPGGSKDPVRPNPHL